MAIGALLLLAFIAGAGPMFYSLPTTVVSSQANDDGDDGNFPPHKPAPSANSTPDETTAEKIDDATRKKRKKNVCSKKLIYSCRFCHQTFDKSQALGGHMNRHRPEREQEDRDNVFEKARQYRQQEVALGFNINGLQGPFWTTTNEQHQMFDRSLDANANHLGSLGTRFVSPQTPYLPTHSNMPSLPNSWQADQLLQPSQQSVHSGHSLSRTNYSNPSYQVVHLQRERPIQGLQQTLHNSGQGQVQMGPHADSNPNLMHASNHFNTSQLQQHSSFFLNQPGPSNQIGPSSQLAGPSSQTIQDHVNNQHIRQSHNPTFQAQPNSHRSVHVDGSGNLAPNININAHAVYTNPVMAIQDHHQFQSGSGHDQRDQIGSGFGGGIFDHMHDHGSNPTVGIVEMPRNDRHDIDSLDRDIEGSLDANVVTRD